MKKLLLTLTLLLTLGFAASAETWSYTVVKGAYTNHDFSNVTIGTKSDITLGDKTWQILVVAIDKNAEPTLTNNGTDPAGIMIGSAAKPPKTITLYSGSNFEGKTISKVSVKVNGGAKSNCSYNAKVTVGSFTQTKENTITTNTNSEGIDLEWTPNTSGEIEIEFSNNTTAVGSSKNAGLKICAISVEYTSDPSDTREVFSFEGFKNYTMPVQDVVAYTLPEHKPAITFESSDATIAEADADGIYAYAAGSATITASWEGDATFKPGSAEFTITVVDAATSIAELREKAAAKDDKIYVNFPMTVTYVNGKYNYVTDGKGDYTLLYDNKNLYELNVNDIIPAGWTAVNCLFSGLEEYDVDGSLPEITEQGEFTPRVVNLADITEEMVNEIVIIKDVNFAAATVADSSANFDGTNGETTIAFRNTFKIASVEAGNYDVFCAVSFYAKSGEPGNVQILPIEYTTPEIVDNEVLVEVIHDRKSGMVSVEYMFEVANHYGREVTVTANIEGFDVEFIVPENEPSNAPAHVASENKTVEGRLVAQHDDLKGVHDDLTVNLTATLDNGTVLHSNAYAINKTTGIENVVIDGNEAAEYFNLQGVRVAEPQAGRIYIVRRGAKATKELVK